MELDPRHEERGATKPAADEPIRWDKALFAGLIVGAIFVLLARGLPWNWSGLFSPTLMGRELKAPGTYDPGLSIGIAGLHMLLSVAYALILAPIVHRLGLRAALITAALVGLGLYLVNLLLFTLLFPAWVSSQREIASAVTHVAFSMIATGAYKGMAKRRAPEPDQAMRNA